MLFQPWRTSIDITLSQQQLMKVAKNYPRILCKLSGFAKKYHVYGAHWTGSTKMYHPSMCPLAISSPCSCNLEMTTDWSSFQSQLGSCGTDEMLVTLGGLFILSPICVVWQATFSWNTLQPRMRSQRPQVQPLCSSGNPLTMIFIRLTSMRLPLAHLIQPALE